VPLSQSFEGVRPAVVAFVPSVVQRSAVEQGDMFPIYGTGVILADGIVATNDHVVKALVNLPRPDNFPKDRFPFVAVLFHSVKPGENEAISEEGIAAVGLEVIGIFSVEGLIPRGEGAYYGPAKPDFSIVRVKAKGLPRVELEGNTDKLIEGVEVGTIGYPMGTDALRAPGWSHQFGPFLQRGIISAILPTRCKTPHSFVINLQSLGGASGSPVFLAETGRVIGILNSGLVDHQPVCSTDGSQMIGIAQGSTNFTYVVPAYYLSSVLRKITSDRKFDLPADTPALRDIIQKSSVTRQKGSGQIRPLPEQINSPDIFDVHVEPLGFAPKPNK
jgi:hypothetical protein